MNQIKAIIFDVDGTLTTIRSIWEYLHRQLGIWESEGLPNLLAYSSGKIDYKEFARKDAEGYGGYHFDYINKLVSQIPHRNGIEICFKNFKAAGKKIFLISTGLDILVNRFHPADYHISNELLFCEGVCSGKVKVNIPIGGKEKYLQRLLNNTDISWDNIMVVGDSEGDLEIMKRAYISVAVNPSIDLLESTADYCIDGHDIHDIYKIYCNL